MSGIDAYRKNAVQTQSPGQLIVMLYEGAIRFLHQALAAMEGDDPKEPARLIGKAIDIITELNCSLDVEAGGDVAQNLRSLYNFSIRHLHQAMLKRDMQMVRDVIACLEELNEGWKAIAT